jgi:hypothetical protein
MDEDCRLQLVNGNKIVLKQKGGPINPAFPHIRVLRDGVHLGNLWTDIYFTSLSYSRRNPSGPPQPGEYHELDIVLTTPDCDRQPLANQVLIGVECKYTDYEKHLLREILGVRRELSLLTAPQRTRFNSWPRRDVPAKPSSCLLVFSRDAGCADFNAHPGAAFGIDFFAVDFPA